MDDELARFRRSVEQDIGALHARHEAFRDAVGFVVPAAVFATALLTLTATTWVAFDRRVSWTAWGLPGAIGLVGLVEIALVVALAAGTLLAVLVRAWEAAVPVTVHRLLCATAVLAAACTVGVVAFSGHNTTTAPGLWLALLATVVLAVVHGGRSAHRSP